MSTSLGVTANSSLQLPLPLPVADSQLNGLLDGLMKLFPSDMEAIPDELAWNRCLQEVVAKEKSILQHKEFLLAHLPQKTVAFLDLGLKGTFAQGYRERTQLIQEILDCKGWSATRVEQYADYLFHCLSKEEKVVVLQNYCPHYFYGSLLSFVGRQEKSRKWTWIAYQFEGLYLLETKRTFFAQKFAGGSEKVRWNDTGLKFGLNLQHKTREAVTEKALEVFFRWGPQMIYQAFLLSLKRDMVDKFFAHAFDDTTGGCYENRCITMQEYLQNHFDSEEFTYDEEGTANVSTEDRLETIFGKYLRFFTHVQAKRYAEKTLFLEVIENSFDWNQEIRPRILASGEFIASMLTEEQFFAFLQEHSFQKIRYRHTSPDGAKELISIQEVPPEKISAIIAQYRDLELLHVGGRELGALAQNRINVIALEEEPLLPLKKEYLNDETAEIARLQKVSSLFERAMKRHPLNRRDQLVIGHLYELAEKLKSEDILFTHSHNLRVALFQDLFTLLWRKQYPGSYLANPHYCKWRSANGYKKYPNTQCFLNRYEESFKYDYNRNNDALISVDGHLCNTAGGADSAINVFSEDYCHTWNLEERCKELFADFGIDVSILQNFCKAKIEKCIQWFVIENNLSRINLIAVPRFRMENEATAFAFPAHVEGQVCRCDSATHQELYKTLVKHQEGISRKCTPQYRLLIHGLHSTLAVRTFSFYRGGDAFEAKYIGKVKEIFGLLTAISQGSLALFLAAFESSSEEMQRISALVKFLETYKSKIPSMVHEIPSSWLPVIDFYLDGVILKSDERARLFCIINCPFLADREKREVVRSRLLNGSSPSNEEMRGKSLCLFAALFTQATWLKSDAFSALCTRASLEGSEERITATFMVGLIREVGLSDLSRAAFEKIRGLLPYLQPRWREVEEQLSREEFVCLDYLSEGKWSTLPRNASAVERFKLVEDFGQALRLMEDNISYFSDIEEIVRFDCSSSFLLLYLATKSRCSSKFLEPVYNELKGLSPSQNLYLDLFKAISLKKCIESFGLTDVYEALPPFLKWLTAKDEVIKNMETGDLRLLDLFFGTQWSQSSPIEAVHSLFSDSTSIKVAGELMAILPPKNVSLIMDKPPFPFLLIYLLGKWPDDSFKRKIADKFNAKPTAISGSENSYKELLIFVSDKLEELGTYKFWRQFLFPVREYLSKAMNSELSDELLKKCGSHRFALLDYILEGILTQNSLEERLLALLESADLQKPLPIEDFDPLLQKGHLGALYHFFLQHWDGMSNEREKVLAHLKEKRKEPLADFPYSTDQLLSLYSNNSRKFLINDSVENWLKNSQSQEKLLLFDLLLDGKLTGRATSECYYALLTHKGFTVKTLRQIGGLFEKSGPLGGTFVNWLDRLDPQFHLFYFFFVGKNSIDTSWFDKYSSRIRNVQGGNFVILAALLWLAAQNKLTRDAFNLLVEEAYQGEDESRMVSLLLAGSIPMIDLRSLDREPLELYYSLLTQGEFSSHVLSTWKVARLIPQEVMAKWLARQHPFFLAGFLYLMNEELHISEKWDGCLQNNIQNYGPVEIVAQWLEYLSEKSHTFERIHHEKLLLILRICKKKFLACPYLAGSFTPLTLALVDDILQGNLTGKRDSEKRHIAILRQQGLSDEKMVFVFSYLSYRVSQQELYRYLLVVKSGQLFACLGALYPALRSTDDDNTLALLKQTLSQMATEEVDWKQFFSSLPLSDILFLWNRSAPPFIAIKYAFCHLAPHLIRARERVVALLPVEQLDALNSLIGGGLIAKQDGDGKVPNVKQFDSLEELQLFAETMNSKEIEQVKLDQIKGLYLALFGHLMNPSLHPHHSKDSPTYLCLEAILKSFYLLATQCRALAQKYCEQKGPFLCEELGSMELNFDLLATRNLKDIEDYLLKGPQWLYKCFCFAKEKGKIEDFFAGAFCLEDKISYEKQCHALAKFFISLFT